MRGKRKSYRIASRREGKLIIAHRAFPINIRNISTTGIKATIRARISVGTTCVITFAEDEEFHVFPARVVRSVTNEVGIIFYNLSTEHKIILAQLVKNNSIHKKP